MKAEFFLLLGRYYLIGLAVMAALAVAVIALLARQWPAIRDYGQDDDVPSALDEVGLRGTTSHERYVFVRRCPNCGAPLRSLLDTCARPACLAIDLDTDTAHRRAGV